MHSLSHGKGLFTALDCAWPGNDRKSGSAECGVSSGERNHCVIRLHIAADQLVRLVYADTFLPARHFVEGPGLNLAAIPSNANGSTLGSGNGVSAITQRLDFVAHRADVFRLG